MVSSSWFRRHQKIIYIVMVFAMFVWGIGYSAMELIPKKPIGKVFGRKITENEFVDMAARWERLFFSQAKESVVSLLWKQLMLLEEAKRMGIIVTPQEVEEGLRRFAFQIFGEDVNMSGPQLEQFICNNFKLNRDQIDSTLREALLIEKLESMVRMSTKMTTDEIWQRYSLENEKVKFKVLALKAKDLVDVVNATEDEIRAYYEKHINDDYHPESGNHGYKMPNRVKIECIVASYDDLGKQISTTDEELRKYYEDNKEQQFKIVDKTSNTATADLTDGKNKTEEKKPAIFIYKSFDEVKADIQKTIVRQKAMEKIGEIMTKLDEEIYAAIDKESRPDFKNLAEKYKLTYKIPKGKKSASEFLTEDDIVAAFPGSNQIVQIAFERDKYEPSLPCDFVEGKVVFQVIDKKPSAAPPLEEIRNEVINDLRIEKGLHKANEICEKHVGKTTGASFEDVVKSIKAELGTKEPMVCETDYITRPMKLFNKESRYIEALKEDRPNVAKKAFELKPGTLGVAMETSGERACYILSLIERKPADKTAFEKEKENVTKQYLYEKQEAFLAQWQANISKGLEVYTKFH